MRLFGFEISRSKASAPVTDMTWASGAGWYPVIREPFAGAWQRNMEQRFEPLETYTTSYACITLRSSDISKCRLKLVEKDNNGIWVETQSSAFSPVLQRPNHYQNRIQFFKNWMVSKDIRGNTIVLKGRDQRGVVNALYILDWCRCKPLVTPDGDVYYQLSADYLAEVGEQVVVPASEIIHDRTWGFHPLCGIPPMLAAALSASQGTSIQQNAAAFFQNGSRPGGVLSAPGTIDDVTAKRLKDHFEANYTGKNAGRIAVLGDGLKFEVLAAKAAESQLAEQLSLSDKAICRAFLVPGFMVGVEAPPVQSNVQALGQMYYSQCLQKDFEEIELLLDEGLGLSDVQGKTYGTEFETDDLLRMDSKTLSETEKNLAGIKSPNESRKRLNLPPTAGGASPYLQQQNYSLEALAKRDAQEDPFASKSPSVAQPSPSNDNNSNNDGAASDPEGEAAAAQIAAWALKSELARLSA